MNNQALSEREMIEDGLGTEKQLLGEYSTFIAEATCQNLRNQVQQIMTETQQMQFGIFNEMQAKGWYQIKQAPLTEVGQALTNLQQVQSQLN